MVVSFVVMVLGIFVIYGLRDFFKKIGTTEVAYFWRPNTFPMLLLSISIFKIFVDLKVKSNKIINTLASTTLGIYLVHDSMLNTYIWKNIFHAKECLSTPYSIIYILASATLVFLVGAVIDLIRQFIEAHTVDKVLNSNRYNKIKDKFHKTFHKIQEII